MRSFRRRGACAAAAAALLAIASGTRTAASELPALPQQDVAAHPIHIVPENVVPAPRPVTFRNTSGGKAAPPANRRRAASRESRPAHPAVQVSGAAVPRGAVALRIGARDLRLFGIRPPAPGDRCAASALGAAPLPCDEAARNLLAAHLSQHAVVSCRLPAPRRAAHSAICLDGSGVDLGGLLVADGLALADAAQGEDYVGAESIARSNRRGLWRYR